MDAFDVEANGYLTWMTVHNYAATTVENRRRYLGYFAEFARSAGALEPSEVSYELVVAYQGALHAYRKSDGTPLSIATKFSAWCP